MHPRSQDTDHEVYAAMLEAIPERLSRYRVADRVVLYCNGAWAAGHGATPGEVVGRSLDELLTPHEMEGLEHQLARLSADQPLLADTAARPAPEGDGRWIEWVDRLMAGPEGDEILSIGRDVTDRYLAEQERRLAEQEHRVVADQLATTMERMGDGLLSLDPDWRILFVNPAGAALIGAEVDDITGRDFREVFPDVAAGELDGLLRTVVERRAPAGIDRVHDGALDTWFEIDAVPTAGGVVVFLRDASARVRREDALERAIATEQRAVESLQQVDRVKTAFLSAVSHELRTPFTVVYGIATTLKRFRGTLTEAERIRLEDTLVGQTERVRGLLDDLLDVDRLARGSVEVERAPVDLTALIGAAVKRWRYDGTFELDAPDEFWAAVDSVQVERIVTNLLENAAKYAPGGHVRMSVSRVRPGLTRLEITDEGPGIPAVELRRVFEPFHRVDDDHPQPGTGIGLALVSEFARIHGGRAWARDTHGRGAHLLVELPDGPTTQGEPGS